MKLTAGVAAKAAWVLWHRTASKWLSNRRIKQMKRQSALGNIGRFFSLGIFTKKTKILDHGYDATGFHTLHIAGGWIVANHR